MYAAAKRQAVAEQAARHAPATPTPSARDLAEQAARAPRPAAPTARDLAEQAATRPAGSIAGMITALGHLTRAANNAAPAMARVNGGQQR
jgi:hypothetical protein